jgi:D-alanyl-D-alanine carboxypeptidase
MYEAWFGMLEPPRDYSVYDMSWVGVAASLISTVADLNRFYGLLLAGEIVDPTSLAHMQRTVPVVTFEGSEIDYGLGLHKLRVPGRGTFWGHDGTAWGAGAMSMTASDRKRQMSVAVNLTRWNRLDSAGKPRPHAIDAALSAFYGLAMGSGEALSR